MGPRGRPLRRADPYYLGRMVRDSAWGVDDAPNVFSINTEREQMIISLALVPQPSPHL